ncbi:hypothetical protein Pcinc_033572 [Petrolisthes cinctipes]|uniref:YEATS domain-containing protein n=1 Tax=Petrolisthes cinctipes TaxID=88211 RepID=A0AAE1ES45_PETCI|nr:hypothetical protein Pcinc_033572 [Petrolisthes cinctipes]
MSAKNVVVSLELGHRATVRKQRVGTDMYTHDWEIYIHGVCGSRVDAFIEKVIFTLHKSFPKPRRVLKSPPYRVCEKGYGSFTLPVEIYFRTTNPNDTRKTQIEYDLFLQNINCPPINNKRIEKFTFLKPSEEFKRLLLQGGGVSIVTFIVL